MKNYYLLVILTVFSCYTYAQTATKLSIQGEAKKKVLPDISLIDILYWPKAHKNIPCSAVDSPINLHT